jgi:hypothetical protein
LPQHTWNTGDQITGVLLNDLEARASAALPASSAAAVATTGAYGDLTGKPTIPGANPWEFRPESYGAVGNNSTDDAAAIRACVNAAVAYAQANNFYAEVVFRPVTYLVGGALQQGGTHHANALIPLPYVTPTTGQKVTLVLRGSREQTSIPHWSQTVAQRAGAFLRTAFTGGTIDVDYGEPSIIGSAATRQGYGGGTDTLWNNMLVVVDGLSVMAPNSPTICGFDFRSLGEAKIISASALVNSVPGSITVPAVGQFTFGLAMPIGNNNDLADVLAWSCEGFGAGLALGEHTTVFSCRCLYSGSGLRFLNGTGAPHGAHIVHASVEACGSAISLESTHPFKVDIDLLDLEPDGTIWDGGNNIVGTIWVNDTGVDPATPTNAELDSYMGAAGTGLNIRLYHRRMLAGPLATMPTVPASTTALRNRCMRDVAITVSGGTVTGIAVEGVTMGITSGTVIVPAGKTITLTYSSAPTWKWIAL